ncbi:MAG: hypothetical protein AB8H80_06505 [Planctomycetota bacterium]
MKNLATALFALLPLATTLAQDAPTAPPQEPQTPTAAEREQLRVELVEMARLDQLHRTPVSWGTTDPKELARLEALDDDAQLEETKRRWRERVRLPKSQEDELMAKQRLLDKANFDKLIGWIRSYGYPDPKRLGIDAPPPVVVLIHADLEWFAPVRDVLLAEAKAGRLNPKKFAAVSDRKAQHAGGRQLYGMCRRFDSKRNVVLPPEIEDIDATNRARAALGLEPLTEYLIVPAKGAAVDNAKK